MNGTKQITEQWWEKNGLFEDAKQILIGIEVIHKASGEKGTVFNASIQKPYEKDNLKVSPRVILSVNFNNYSRSGPIWNFVPATKKVRSLSGFLLSKKE